MGHQCAWPVPVTGAAEARMRRGAAGELRFGFVFAPVWESMVAKQDAQACLRRSDSFAFFSSGLRGLTWHRPPMGGELKPHVGLRS